MVEHAFYERSGDPVAVTSRPRVLLADDNPEILDTVAEILKRECLVLEAVLDGQSVLRDALTLRPDVIVLDISLGDLTGIEVARHLQEMGCRAKIVFLTVHENPDFIRAAFEAGASAYVFKSALGTDLIEAIEAVNAGETFISYIS
ncbi:MAG TPA: response regulator transcription factor [Terriglobales bacterium]|nr:response regulator transcription factor [Terriglobales bacterium]